MTLNKFIKDLIFFIHLIDKNATYGSVSAVLICIVILNELRTVKNFKKNNEVTKFCLHLMYLLLMSHRWFFIMYYIFSREIPGRIKWTKVISSKAVYFKLSTFLNWNIKRDFTSSARIMNTVYQIWKKINTIKHRRKWITIIC